MIKEGLYEDEEIEIMERGEHLTLILYRGGLKCPFYIFNGKSPHFAVYLIQNDIKLIIPQTSGHYAQIPQL